MHAICPSFFYEEINAKNGQKLILNQKNIFAPVRPARASLKNGAPSNVAHRKNPRRLVWRARQINFQKIKIDEKRASPPGARPRQWRTERACASGARQILTSLVWVGFGLLWDWYKNSTKIFNPSVFIDLF